MIARAFDEKVESIVDSHDGTNQIQRSHWCKGAGHEWGSRIPTICANVSLLQSKPVKRVCKSPTYTTWLFLSTLGGFIKRKRETGRVSPDKFGGYKTFALEPHTTLVQELVAEQPDSTLAELAKEGVKASQSGISRFLHHINSYLANSGYT
jgi:hypothetical protein